jgi:arsenite-transporting ATPase
MEGLKKQTNVFKNILKDQDLCTFIAVCQAEFFSVFETERLVQELTMNEIDISNIVINMIVYPEGDCKKCRTRYKMQRKYIDQIHQLYDDFHVTPMFQLDEEIRGVEGLKSYAVDLLKVKELPELL